MLHNKLQIVCQKIISGGQTGVDRGVWDACLDNNFKYGGWCPKGRMAEDGKIDIKYNLKTTQESNYSARTYKNIQDSDATLIISNRNLKGGTLLTKQIAEHLKKPLLIYSPQKSETEDFGIKLIRFIQNNNVLTLNIAGPRLSEWGQGYTIAYKLVSELVLEVQKTSQNTDQL